jgi:hypothetical protein
VGAIAPPIAFVHFRDHIRRGQISPSVSVECAYAHSTRGYRVAILVSPKTSDLGCTKVGARAGSVRRGLTTAVGGAEQRSGWQSGVRWAWVGVV